MAEAVGKGICWSLDTSDESQSCFENIDSWRIIKENNNLKIPFYLFVEELVARIAFNLIFQLLVKSNVRAKEPRIDCWQGGNK